MKPEIFQELTSLEHAGWKSLCDGTAAEFYGNLMSSEGLMILANGMVMDRDQVTEALREAPTWDGYEIRNEKLVPLGSDFAVLVYEGVGRRDGEADFVAQMSSVYVRVDGAWKLAVYSQTPVHREG